MSTDTRFACESLPAPNEKIPHGTLRMPGAEKITTWVETVCCVLDLSLCVFVEAGGFLAAQAPYFAVPRCFCSLFRSLAACTPSPSPPSLPLPSSLRLYLVLSVSLMFFTVCLMVCEGVVCAAQKQKVFQFRMYMYQW